MNLYGIIATGNKFPKDNNKKIRRYCACIIDTVKNDERFIEIIDRSVEVITNSRVDISDRKSCERKATLDLLYELL